MARHGYSCLDRVKGMERGRTPKCLLNGEEEKDLERGGSKM